MSNTKILLNQFGTDQDFKDFENMKNTFSLRDAIKWLSIRVKQISINKKALKALNDEGRLMPDRKFNRYSKEILMNYYLETKPRK